MMNLRKWFGLWLEENGLKVQEGFGNQKEKLFQHKREILHVPVPVNHLQ